MHLPEADTGRLAAPDAPPTGSRMAGLVAAITGLLVIACLVDPRGDYPLNDDWQYARVTKRLAETGEFRVDVKIAPALVAQAYLALPVVRVFGFSHTGLRSLTMIVAVVLLWALDSLLRLAQASRTARLLAVALLLSNPLFLHVAFSFMTEIYGSTLALLSAWAWFAGRARPPGPAGAVSWRSALPAAALAGASFWTRQLSAVVFPALVVASLLRMTGRREWEEIARSRAALGGSSLLYAGIVGAYFPWAQASGNYAEAFQSPLRALTTFDPTLWCLSFFEGGIYLTGFLVPFLVLRLRGPMNWRRAGIGGLLWATFLVAAKGMQPVDHFPFPYGGNLVYDAGIGPLTLATTSWSDSTLGPHWGMGPWRSIEAGLLVLSFAWCALLTKPSRTGERPRALAAEIRHFAIVCASMTFVLTVQAFQDAVFDRYYLPLVLFGVLALGSSAEGAPPPAGGWASPHAVLAATLTLPLAWFSVAGVHDYFRWNDARWALVGHALSTGISPTNLDGGYEVDGWLNLDAFRRGVIPSHCVGRCGCHPDAVYCTDASYAVSMGTLPGRETLRLQLPHYWLASGPPLVLSRRRP